ncbi:hypothetical protein X777_05301 [Ooceraea biroi]|uniref:LRRNT domain-containing protein n=1 Tax=Ooceraea biroi TaxID=2015173 RepID=A0A026WGS3_OOCBI|nr:hypothetical protein X777_05301 [Ooceraea biroi]
MQSCCRIFRFQWKLGALLPIDFISSGNKGKSTLPRTKTVSRHESRTHLGTVDPWPKTSIKIKSVGAVPQDARERVVPLVVDNNSLEGPASGEEGGHENGPRKGPLDGLAREQPSTRSSWQESEDRLTDTQDSETVFGPELVTVDIGLGSTGERIELDERIGNVQIKRPGSPIVLTIQDDDVPISVQRKRQSEGPNGAALELQSADGDSDARSKRSGKTLDDDNDNEDDELPAARRICAAHRHRVSCHAARAHAEPPCRRGANRGRPCRVHDHHRYCSRGKSTERPEHRHLRFHDPENAIVRLEQDPILHPVRILGCPPAEGQEISSFLEPAGPSYVYTSGHIGVGQFAGGEPYCFALHNPDNILPKSRAGSIARFLDGPNRAVREINRKVLAMARAMTPVWSLRLLGVSCGSVVCAWGLLLILSVLGGTSHGTGIGNFGPDNMSGKMEDLNGVRCPWACTCGGQEVDCSHRGLTQIPGDLASLLIAEKL